MQLSLLTSLLSVASAKLGNSKYDDVDYEIQKFEDAVSPQVVVVSLFKPEAEVWHSKLKKTDLALTEKITIPGLSPLFPSVYCSSDYTLCNVITGEGEINAAATMTAFLSSAQFNLTETYFLVAGIAGIDPNQGTLGSAAFPRFTVQVANQYEIAPQEAPTNWTSPYWQYGTEEPFKEPQQWYGTEVFEINEALRDHAAKLAFSAELADSAAANKTRNLYNSSQAATLTPGILKCDSSTSDVYFTGTLLDEAFAHTTKVLTNGSATYCVTAQEDAAVLEAALRNAKFGLTDFARWVLLRTGSNFDRPPAVLGNDSVGFFNNNSTGGFEIALENQYIAGYPFVKDVLKNWNGTYKNGTDIPGQLPLSTPVGSINLTNSSSFQNITVSNYTLTNLSNATNGTISTNGSNLSNSTNGTYAPTNYIGDVFGTLGGKPDFGNSIGHDSLETDSL